MNFKAEQLVFIVGRLKLQNELLSQFLVNDNGLVCTTMSDPFNIEAVLNKVRIQQPYVTLWDCLNLKTRAISEQLDLAAYTRSSLCHLALFNINPDIGSEEELIKRGVRGLFFESDNPSVIQKGVMAILNGEYWFPRDTLVRCLTVKRENPAGNSLAIRLTPRESEILGKVASGASNHEIAHGLAISPHTVKTHLYNIYQKIKVPNRLQAALWASRNLRI